MKQVASVLEWYCPADESGIGKVKYSRNNFVFTWHPICRVEGCNTKPSFPLGCVDEVAGAVTYTSFVTSQFITEQRAAHKAFGRQKEFT